MSDVFTDIMSALDFNNSTDDRTLQSREGRLGPSDIGFCRNKAVLVTRQVKPTDEKSMWAANVGTAIHNYVEAALKKSHPDWLMGSIDKTVVEAELPSGVRIGGHPDILIPEYNMVIDIKTVDGFGWTKKNGPSLSHRYQRHLYAMGAMQQDILQPEGLMVGNLYFDRSGKEKVPLLFIEPYEDHLTFEIDNWIGDVIYAVENGEDSARDVAAPQCAQICEFFTICRGGTLPSNESQLIEGPDQIKAIDMHVEALRLEKEAKELKGAAREILDGINGTDGRYQVRWVTVNGYEYPAGSRASSVRLDIKPVKNA